MEKRNIYLDNGAATRVDEKVVEYMNHFHLVDYAVASSQFSHTPGIRARDGVETARQIIARSIGAPSEEIIFTSGSTESNNLALKGVAYANMKGNRNKIVVSKIEHFSVLDSAKRLSKQGYQVEFVDVDGEGFINLEQLEKLVDENTLLVSIIHANHEVGTIQDLDEISKIVHSKGAYLHTDATYSYLQVPVQVSEPKIDLLTIDSNMIHGPKGVGALFVNEDVKIEKIQDGGFQKKTFVQVLRMYPQLLVLVRLWKFIKKKM